MWSDSMSVFLISSVKPKISLIQDQRSADRVRNEINSLGSMINVNIKPVFTSRKLSQTLSVEEKKPPIVNTQCVVYSFQCDLCDANYVLLPDTYTNALVNTTILLSVNTLKHNMTIKEQRSITSLKS